MTARKTRITPLDDLDQATRRRWDVIVVGTGMAGATLGFALARGGKQVLFIEKGEVPLHGALEGTLAELVDPDPSAELLRRAGRYAEALIDASNGAAKAHVPFLGMGAGGSSALYGAAMERFFESDFTPRAAHGDVAGSSLPEAWPISYEQMRPYYERAEALYRVRGSRDPSRHDDDEGPLMSPPPLSEASAALETQLSERGLHPYRLPQACEFVPGCEGCQGFLCPNNCKNDSTRVCLWPALEEHGAALLPRCEVLALEASRRQVEGVVCRQHGRVGTVRGKTVVLAAGALASPHILLASADARWPHGLANHSQQVGRNLMRHYIDLWALPPLLGEMSSGNRKELAFNDLYQRGGLKFGTVQSFGQLPPASVLVHEMHQELRSGRRRWLGPLFRLAKPFLRFALDKVLSRRTLFASLMEDLPFAHNSVLPPTRPGAPLRFRYTIAKGEKARIKHFRRELRTLFRPLGAMLLKQAENNKRIAHACGTCRFGDDARTSVLDRNNRAHDLDNLYIPDASFFPSSAGTNPALTLAANALRVADHMQGVSAP